MLFEPSPRTGALLTANYTGRPTSSPTNVAAGGSAHALSASFVDLITPTHDCWGLYVFIHNSAGTPNSDALLNLYKGSAGNEEDFIMGLLAGWTSNPASALPGKTYFFPVYIPAGTRISAKSQSETASLAIRTQVMALGGGRPPMWVGTKVETLGVDTGASAGTSVTPGAASEGSFTSIGTSTRKYGYVTVGLQGTLADTSPQNQLLYLDVGQSGSLIPGLEAFMFATSASDFTFSHEPMGRFCIVPDGAALELRGQCSGATAEAVDCAIYGVS